MIVKKGVHFLQRLYLRLCLAAALPSNWPRILRELASITLNGQPLQRGVA